MSDLSTEEFSAEAGLAQMDVRDSGGRWLTPTSIGISLVLVAVFAYALPYLYLKLNFRAGAGGYLPVIAVFPFLVLLALNGLLRRLGVGLARGEITVVLCTMMVSLVTLVTVMMMFTLIPASVRHATDGQDALFLWSVDRRLLPYQLDVDKEREKTAGAYDENLNWYYMAIPDRPVETGKRRKAGAQGGATTTPAAALVEAEYYDPAGLKIPWWRWVRTHGIDRSGRLEAYAGLGEEIGRARDAKKLEPEVASGMLAEVDLLTRLTELRVLDGEAASRAKACEEVARRVQGPGTGLLLVRLALLRQDIDGWFAACDGLGERVRQAQGLDSETVQLLLGQADLLKNGVYLREEVAGDLEDRIRGCQAFSGAVLRSMLEEVDRIEKSAGVRSKACSEFEEWISQSKTLNPSAAQAMLAGIEVVRKNDFGQEDLCDDLAKQVREAPGLEPAAARAAVMQLDLLKKNIAERSRASAALSQRIRAASGLQPVAARLMLAEVDLLDRNSHSRERVCADAAARVSGAVEARQIDLATAGGILAHLEILGDAVSTVPVAQSMAYEKLLELLSGSQAIDLATAESLVRRVKSERANDSHIAWYLDVPPERSALNAPWYRWTGPMLWWVLLLVLFIVLQFCVAALLRRQWVDHEKLLFPQVEIIEATTAPGLRGIPGGQIAGNRLFWVGFTFAVLLFALEGIHSYWPAVPGFYLAEDFSLNQVMTNPPWSGLPRALDLHLFVIAIAFLLPAEISLSLWVFVLVDMAVKFYMVATNQTHHTTEPVCGYLINGGTDQVAGIVIFIGALIYSGRRHFQGVLRKAFGMGKDVDDSEEPLPYFGAFWGMVLCAVGIVLWCYAMGMSPLLSVLIFGLTFLAVMFLARIVCELGIVTGQYQDPTTPGYIIAGSLGYRTNVGNNTLLNRLLFMTPTYTTWGYLWVPLFFGFHVMPMAMTADRMFKHGQSRRRFTFFLMILTLGVLLVFAGRAISIPYQEGAMQLKQGRWSAGAASHTFNNCLARDFIRKQTMHKPFPPIYLGAVSGGVVMTVLLTLRHLFYWWPLHPIGYICAGLAGGVWFSVFIGWFIKRAMLKYGGGRLFRGTIPLFVGLLVGHILIAGIWLAVGAWREALSLDGIYSSIWSQPYGR